MKSRTVTASSGDTRTGIQSNIGGNVSEPITTATTYTLTCLDLSGSPLSQTAAVHILPAFQEQ